MSGHVNKRRRYHPFKSHQAGRGVASDSSPSTPAPATTTSFTRGRRGHASTRGNLHGASTDSTHVTASQIVSNGFPIPQSAPPSDTPVASSTSTDQTTSSSTVEDQARGTLEDRSALNWPSALPPSRAVSTIADEIITDGREKVSENYRGGTFLNQVRIEDRGWQARKQIKKGVLDDSVTVLVPTLCLDESLKEYMRHSSEPHLIDSLIAIVCEYRRVLHRLLMTINREAYL